MSKPEPGKIVHSRYRIIEKIGQGAMATVYSAEDQKTGTRFALKMMGMFADSEEETQLAIQQFEHEASLLHTLRHPNIPRVYEWFEEDNQRFLVMDLIDGEVLSRYADIVSRNTKEPEYVCKPTDVVNWAIQIARALQYLHEQEPTPIVYKDLKPDNLMLNTQGQIMMIDFGIAKGRDSAGQYKTIIKGMVTPGYAAPEQYAGADTDPRTDLYALGATMYALIGGRVPPQAVDRHERIYSKAPDPLKPIRQLNRDASKELQQLIIDLMALKRDQRPQTAGDVVMRLLALPEAAEQEVPKIDYKQVRHMDAPGDTPVEQPTRSTYLVAGIIVAALMVAAFGVWIWMSRSSPPPAHPHLFTKPISQPSESQ